LISAFGRFLRAELHNELIQLHRIQDFDASFGRALPVLEQGDYLEAADLPAARKILTACALTYVAASLLSLLNAWRWLRFARR